MPDVDDDTQTDHPSEDDALEPPDDIFNPARDEERLDQDGNPPAAPPDDTPNTLPPDHPETDTDLDTHEIYDEGITGATDVDASKETTSTAVQPLDSEDQQ